MWLRLASRCGLVRKIEPFRGDEVGLFLIVPGKGNSPLSSSSASESAYANPYSEPEEGDIGTGMEDDFVSEAVVVVVFERCRPVLAE